MKLIQGFVANLVPRAAILAITVAALPALAQQYPVKPVRLVTPFGAGAGPEIVARLVGDKLTKYWGQTFVVENRPGGNGVIAVEAVRFRTGGSPLVLPGNAYRPDRLCRCPSGRPGDPAHRNRNLRMTMGKRSGNHLDHGLLRHGAVPVQRCRFDAEHFALGDVGIRNEPALEPFGRAGNRSNRFADPAAGAGFRGRQRCTVRFERSTHTGRQIVQLVCHS